MAEVMHSEEKINKVIEILKVRFKGITSIENKLKVSPHPPPPMSYGKRSPILHIQKGGLRIAELLRWAFCKTKKADFLYFCIFVVCNCIANND